MRRWMLAFSATAALVAAGVAAAIGVAGGGDGGRAAEPVEPGYESPGQPVRRVARPAAAAQASAAEVVTAATRRGKPARIKYFQTDPFTITDEEGLGERLRCPRKHRVLGGYFGVGEAIDVALTYSAPFNRRAWFVGVTKLGIEGQPAAPEVVLGIVCAVNVR